MENRELIYELAKRLNMLIHVEKEGKYIGEYKFINDKLHKLNDSFTKEKMQVMQDRKNEE